MSHAVFAGTPLPKFVSTPSPTIWHVDHPQIAHQSVHVVPELEDLPHQPNFRVIALLAPPSSGSGPRACRPCSCPVLAVSLPAVSEQGHEELLKS